MNKFRGLADLGPAIVVAVVAFGPGSILTAAQVGATLGPWGLAAVFVATALMIGSTVLAVRVGALFEGTPCGELRARLGPFAAVSVGFVLFGIVAIFQSSNNASLIAGVETLIPSAISNGEGEPGWLDSAYAKGALLLAANGAALAFLFVARSLYKLIERLMKALMLAMVVAFTINFAVALFAAPAPSQEQTRSVVESLSKRDWLPLLGLIGTTYSVGGAFYQAYLVRERKWGPEDLRRGQFDAYFGGTALGLVTALMLLTGMLAFFGRLSPEAAGKLQVVDIARSLEPLFGEGARVVFGVGLLAAAFSSFLVNAMVGGTILADSLGWGSHISERWPKTLSAVALLIGMAITIAAFFDTNSSTGLIVLAQALTVIGLPALAAALLYLGVQRQPDGRTRIATPWLTLLAILGFILSCILAGKWVYEISAKLLATS
jgi:Mn2+/Fe2+ NRAMP family transporter